MYGGNYLGRFEIPAERFGKKLEDWVPYVRYIPEAPIQTRGGMNPWQQEQQRVVYELEQKNWIRIQSLQNEYNSLSARLPQLIRDYNATVEGLNRRVKDAGGKGVMGTLGMVGMGLSFVPGAGWAAAAIQAAQFIKMGFDALFGANKRRKRDIRNWSNAVAKLAQEIGQTTERMQSIAQEIPPIVAETDSLKSAQQVSAQVDRAVSQGAYLARQLSDQQAGMQQAALVRQAQAIPQRRIYDVL